MKFPPFKIELNQNHTSTPAQMNVAKLGFTADSDLTQPARHWALDEKAQTWKLYN